MTKNVNNTMDQSEFEEYKPAPSAGMKRASEARFVLFCFSLVEKLARNLATNHRVQ